MVVNAKKLLAKRDKPALSKERAVSTGTTLLNLSCTDRPRLGFIKGKYYYLVGDSASGKTWLSLSCFAEATLNEHFSDYRLIFDDVEDGALMDMEFYFGKEVAKRIEPPSRTKTGTAQFSSTIEDFYYHIEDLILAGKPFIYVLDSQDALNSKAAEKKFKKQKKAQEKGEEEKGSYGADKAKYHSERLRHVIAGLRKTGSILIIIGQTRDNVGNPMSFEKRTRSGGKALRFYATLEIWTSILRKIQRKVRGISRTVGVNVLAEIKKNRISGKIGKDRAVTIPIYYDLGIDDVGSCVDYLIQWRHWKKVRKKGEAEKPPEIHGIRGKKEKKKTIYDCPEIMFQGTRAAIISYIEEEDLEEKLKDITADVWKQVDEESKVKRKKRYI